MIVRTFLDVTGKYCLTHSCLQISLKDVVWTNSTFENNMKQTVAVGVIKSVTKKEASGKTTKSAQKAQKKKWWQVLLASACKPVLKARNIQPNTMKTSIAPVYVLKCLANQIIKVQDPLKARGKGESSINHRKFFRRKANFTSIKQALNLQFIFVCG